MKKNIILLALLLVMVFSASAQHHRPTTTYKSAYGSTSKSTSKVGTVYGFMAGVNFPSLNEKHNNLEIENITGFGIGMMMGFSFGYFDLIPELWYSQNKSEIEMSSTRDRNELKSKDIEIPIIVSIPFAPRMKFNIGPTFSVMNNSSLIVNGVEEIDFGRTKSSVGYVIGLSVMATDKIFVDVRYTGRYSSVDQQWYDGDETYHFQYYNIGLNLGCRF